MPVASSRLPFAGWLSWHRGHTCSLKAPSMLVNLALYLLAALHQCFKCLVFMAVAIHLDNSSSHATVTAGLHRVTQCRAASTASGADDSPELLLQQLRAAGSRVQGVQVGLCCKGFMQPRALLGNSI